MTRRQKLEDQRNSLEFQELQACTFAPAINKSTTKPSRGPVVVRGLGRFLELKQLAKRQVAERKYNSSHFKISVEFAMKSEEIWNAIKDELLALSVQDVYMILNVVCLLVFVYYLVCVVLGVAPKEKKPDPTLLKAYSFGHWWLWTLLGVANLSERVFGITMFAIPVERLKELLRSTPKEADQFFGDPATTIELFDTVIDDLAKTSTLSAYGRYMVTKDLTASLLARKAFMEYVVEHPEVIDETVEAPIVITGVARTGQNLLYNLLALDPSLRAPRHYESEAMAYSPVAPPKAGAVDSTHIWHNRSYHAWQSTYRLVPELYESLVAVQYMDPISFCDDTVISQHVMPSTLYSAVLGDAARRLLVALPNASNVYSYLRRYLQMLQTNQTIDTTTSENNAAATAVTSTTAPSKATSWLLKAPFHASHLSQLRVAFPDALMHPALKGKALDKKHLGRVALDLCSEKAAALHDFQSSKSSSDVVDISYDDLAADPIDVVKTLYAKWNKDVSDEHAEKMQAYLTDKPKGKYGELKYSLEEFGLSTLVVDSLFAKYSTKGSEYIGNSDLASSVPGSPLIQTA
ncbi:hypothetical protein DYB30_009621 [Aphanomyces astaci]|uniref:Sulfotransferase domain-containing protein n=1 Tax=Aphanomyces astaci TaxID=112090 RepID=A0A397CFT2_APHAT|nr:hypothetical protein DYB30_009621 [Aphanomyces astaci]